MGKHVSSVTAATDMPDAPVSSPARYLRTHTTELSLPLQVVMVAPAVHVTFTLARVCELVSVVVVSEGLAVSACCTCVPNVQ